MTFVARVLFARALSTCLSKAWRRSGPSAMFAVYRTVQMLKRRALAIGSTAVGLTSHLYLVLHIPEFFRFSSLLLLLGPLHDRSRCAGAQWGPVALSSLAAGIDGVTEADRDNPGIGAAIVLLAEYQ